MLSGFLSSGNLCLIHHLKLFWPHAASTASDKKGAKTQHEFSQFFFQNIKRKWCYSSNLLNSRTWKPLKSSVVIFQALETSSALLTSVASATSLASTAYKAQLPKKLLDPDGLIITGTKITIAGNFLWNGSSKIQFFTNIWHSFWRRPLRPHEVKKISIGGSGINFHYSGSHWASVFGRFVKTSGQARFLLFLNY